MNSFPNLAVDERWRSDATSLYVHIPFCASRCFYCDFTTYVTKSDVVDRYVDSLARELEMLAGQHRSALKTIFFGGGTPTLLTPKQLEVVLSSLSKSFKFESSLEFTFEANPGTVTADKLNVLQDFGVNRLSFGAQTFNSRLLMAIGRSHDTDAVIDSVMLAHSRGFRRINVDLMFGLPEQTIEDVDKSIEELLKLPVEHVSAYWLKVEPGTPFAKWQEQGILPLPGEDDEADMYDVVCERLESAGFVHYEVSNFAKPGAEALHNLVYWKNEPYLAAGVGAHGYVFGERYDNVKGLVPYTEAISQGRFPINDRQSVSKEEACEDTMMLGLRLKHGVSRTEFRARHGVDMYAVFQNSIDQLTAKGLLEFHGDNLRLTASAWPIANYVFEQFVGVLTVD